MRLFAQGRTTYDFAARLGFEACSSEAVYAPPVQPAARLDSEDAASDDRRGMLTLQMAEDESRAVVAFSLVLNLSRQR